MPFRDRRDAGRRLIGRVRGLLRHGDIALPGPVNRRPGGQRAESGGGGDHETSAASARPDIVVLGVTRGGVPVAFEVAAALHAPLDVTVVRKLCAPYQPRLAFGAVGENGVGVIDEEVMRRAFVSDSERITVETAARRALSRSALRYRATHPPIPLAGVTALVIDDAVATGISARAACAVARAQGARRVVLAVPIGSPRAVRVLGGVADHVVCLETPRLFHSPAQWYQDFDDVTDRDIVGLLDRAAALRDSSGYATPPVL